MERRCETEAVPNRTVYTSLLLVFYGSQSVCIRENASYRWLDRLIRYSFVQIIPMPNLVFFTQIRTPSFSNSKSSLELRGPSTRGIKDNRDEFRAVAVLLYTSAIPKRHVVANALMVSSLASPRNRRF